MVENKTWYAVYTKPRWEKKLAVVFSEKGIEYYCPLNKVMRQWSDRQKIVMEPLFKGYIFVRVQENEKWAIREIQGVLNYVHWLGKPAVVQPEEIDTIRKFLDEFEGVEVSEAGINAEDKVIIKQGLMMNYEGIVLEVTGNRAKVRIDSMGIVLSAVFDKKNLEKAMLI